MWAMLPRTQRASGCTGSPWGTAASGVTLGGWRSACTKGRRGLVCHHRHTTCRGDSPQEGSSQPQKAGWLYSAFLGSFLSFHISYMRLNIYSYIHKHLYTRQCYSKVLVLLVRPVSTASPLCGPTALTLLPPISSALPTSQLGKGQGRWQAGCFPSGGRHLKLSAGSPSCGCRGGVEYFTVK